MICSICNKKPATDYLSVSVDDKLRKLDLCRHCAKAYAVDSVAPELRCSHCGFTQAEFRKTGRLGCPACYKTFSAEMRGMITTMHKGTRHTGKTPGRHRSVQVTARRRTLEDKLDLALFLEHYEEAAHFHDEISRLPAI